MDIQNAKESSFYIQSMKAHGKNKQKLRKLTTNYLVHRNYFVFQIISAFFLFLFLFFVSYISNPYIYGLKYVVGSRS